MAKPYYVKFEIPENLVSPIYESLRVAVETGKVKRGTNEATKAIERGVSKLIIIAEDVEPSSDKRRVIPNFCPTNPIAIFLILSIS